MEGLNASNAPLDPTLLPPTFATHSLTDNTPEDFAINIPPLLDGHLRDDARQLFLFLLGPRAGSPPATVLQVVAPAVTAVASHAPDDLANALPLLTELIHSPDDGAW